MMRKLNHPNIIHFLGVVYENERLSIITEFVEGGTLKGKVNNGFTSKYNIMIRKLNSK